MRNQCPKCADNPTTETNHSEVKSEIFANPFLYKTTNTLPASISPKGAGKVKSYSIPRRAHTLSKRGKEAQKAKRKQLTILRVAVVDITITEGPPAGQIPANPNRHDLTQLVEQVIEL